VLGGSKDPPLLRIISTGSAPRGERMASSLKSSHVVSDRPRRLEGFSYKGRHRYFVTICTRDRVRVFEEATHASWVTTQIQQLFEPTHFAVLAFCVMPDHVHLLFEGLTTDADLKATMHNWKQRTGFAWKQTNGGRLWQEGFYDHVLREFDSVPGVVRYIVDNPIRRGFGSSYPYVGSSRYTRPELDGAADWYPQRDLTTALSDRRRGGSLDPPPDMTR